MYLGVHLPCASPRTVVYSEVNIAGQSSTVPYLLRFVYKISNGGEEVDVMFRVKVENRVSNQKHLLCRGDPRDLAV